MDVAPGDAESLRAAHQALVRRGTVAEAYEASSLLLQSLPGFAPAVVLEAQALLVEGRDGEVMERLRPVVGQFPSYDAALLVLARAAERVGSSVEALEAYGQLSERSQLAASRFRLVLPEALEVLEQQVVDALRSRRLDDARRRLEVMERWAPKEIATFTATARVAAAAGDADAELGALRQLGKAGVLSRELILRRARLELDVGDPSAGLRIVQDLSAADPADAQLAGELARAQFHWRLGLLPEKVKEVAALPELTRGDLAVLLFWLFPSVRYGQAESGRIANDVLDHPHRQEIVRVANLGIMSVDARLHRFAPDRPLSRAGALAPILRVLDRQRPRPSCLEGREVPDRVSPAVACELGVRCGLLEQIDECQPELAPSGPTTLEWARRALAQLGAG